MAKREPIPQQKYGAHTDTIESTTLDSSEEAERLFQIAKTRLLNVSQWHTLSGMKASHFQLTDNLGRPVSRPAQKGDHFRIEIPGPGSKAGEGYDWVRIETVDSEIDNGKEWLAIMVHPAENPTAAQKEAAHFFTSDASSTFMVVRSGNTVSAEVHSRNEKSNNQETGVVDTIRNTFVALGAMLGFSKVQWTQLVKGLIAKNEEKGDDG